MAPPEAADLALHAALLMGTVEAWTAEERVEPEVAAQRGEPFRLSAIAALEYPNHGGFEVVVTDPARDTPEIGEGQHMALQKGFLRLGGERNVKGLARVRQSHHKHPALHHHTGDRRVELAEVDLCLSPGQMRLRDRHLMGQQPEFDPPAGHVTRHRHLRQRCLMLGDQALPDPPGSMALLARRVLVCDEPGVDHRDPRIDRRPRSNRIHLPRRRDRRRERLTNRPTMHPMTIGKLADRQLIESPVSPDHFEQFHA